LDKYTKINATWIDLSWSHTRRKQKGRPHRDVLFLCL